MTRFSFLLLAVVVLFSITYINLAGTLHVLRRNSINIRKLDPRGAAHDIFKQDGRLSRQILWVTFFPFSLILEFGSQTADLPLPSLLSLRNPTPHVCTLLKSTVFWKLVRQSCLRQSSWEERPSSSSSSPLSSRSFLICPIFPRSLSLAQKLYISCLAQCVLFEISLTQCRFDFY